MDVYGLNMIEIIQVRKEIHSVSIHMQFIFVMVSFPFSTSVFGTSIWNWPIFLRWCILHYQVITGNFTYKKNIYEKFNVWNRFERQQKWEKKRFNYFRDARLVLIQFLKNNHRMFHRKWNEILNHFLSSISIFNSFLKRF